ncbi:MAG: NAD-dependent epimerase/dehydratase family protein [Polyangiales bacterium]
MSKVLVTGASGFIGSRIVRQLCERGDRVKVLLREGSSTAALGKLPVEICRGDITVGHTVYRALAGCDRLLHVAAVYKMWDSDPSRVLEPSIRGTREVLEAAGRRGSQIERIVVTSSVAAIGSNSAAQPLDESAPWNLDDGELYVVAKRRAEELALSMSSSLPIVVVNPGAVFGPGDRKPTPSGALVLRYLNWPYPFAFPGGPGGMSVCDVDDIARGHLLALERGRVGDRYILGGENLTLSKIIETMSLITGLPGPGSAPPKAVAILLGSLMELTARLTDGEPELTRKMARDFFDSYFWVDSGKATRELGYSFRPAKKTLARAIRWYLDHGYVAPAIARELRFDELPGSDPEPTLPHERDLVFKEG